MILQHPQEPDRELGTAQLAHLCLPNSTLRVGLSWPNLSAALLGKTAKGATTERVVLSSRWGVLYLGTGLKNKPGSVASKVASKTEDQIQLISKKQTENSEKKELNWEGLIVLDGTWSQSKALWWRNAWLLKLQRAVLTPAKPSLYGSLRREPKREALSTIESIGSALSILESNPKIKEVLNHTLGAMLSQYRRVKQQAKSGTSAQTTK